MGQYFDQYQEGIIAVATSVLSSELNRCTQNGKFEDNDVHATNKYQHRNLLVLTIQL